MSATHVEAGLCMMREDDDLERNNKPNGWRVVGDVTSAGQDKS